MASKSKRAPPKQAPKRAGQRGAKASNLKPKHKADASVSKLDAMVSALRASGRVSITQLSELTGWQRHSIRGAMSGTLKRKRGLTITSVKRGDDRFYRIEGRA